jgi:hypothetical protein
MRAGWATLAAIVAVTILAVARGLQYGIWANGEPGPGLFPLLASLLIVAAVPAVVLEMRRPAAGAPEMDDVSVPTPATLATYIAVALIWPLLLEPLGYVGASLPALLVLLLRGGIGWMLSTLIAVGAVGASYLLFDTLLEVPLPAADWM